MLMVVLLWLVMCVGVTLDAAHRIMPALRWVKNLNVVLLDLSWMCRA